MYLIDIHRTFHPQTAEYIFFSRSHGILPRIYHTLGHKINLDKLEKIEIISSIFSDHKDMKQENNYRKKKKNLKKHKHMETE